MRKLYTLLLFATLSLASAFAQTNGTGYVNDGYYRVKNYKTERYVYVTDNKDYSNAASDTEEFQAIQLWKDLSQAVSAPASVIYFKKVGTDAYDLIGQGTGLYTLTGHYATAKKQRDGTYEVSASKGGVTKYLSDDRTNNSQSGKIGTRQTGDYRKWVVDKIETNHATNYFGIKPTIELNGKYYQPFFASFPFKVASANMHVYYVSKIAGNEAVLKEIEGEIPASCPVVIECASANPSNNRLELLNSSSAKVSGNKLLGVYFCNSERPEESVDAYKIFNASTMRLLTTSNGKLILTNNESELFNPDETDLSKNRLEELWVIDWDTEDDINILCIPANTSYLKADAGTPAVLDIRFEGVGIDEILAESKDKSAPGVYTLSGTQLRATNDVKGLPAGLYIVGGHKFVIK